MSSLKQLIYNALFKAATLKDGEETVEYLTSEAARDAYIKLVMDELFPEEAVPTAPSPKKATSKKAKKEEPAPAPAAASAMAVLIEETAPEEVTVPMPAAAGAGSPKKASPKKPKQSAEEKEAAKAEAKAAKEAEKVKAKEDAKAAKEAEKAKAKEAKAAEKAKAKSDLNLQKIDPTWRKALKEAEKDKEKAKEHEAPLLAYLNAMSNVAFNSKGAKEHVAAFLSTLATPAPVEAATEMVDASLEVVEFNGKDYYVNPETKRVYEGELDDDGVLKVTRPVGYAGMAEFKDMTLE